jgi:hypothetical protein
MTYRKTHKEKCRESRAKTSLRNNLVTSKAKKKQASTLKARRKKQWGF